MSECPESVAYLLLQILDAVRELKLPVDEIKFVVKHQAEVA
jgi:hypothetical protein